MKPKKKISGRNSTVPEWSNKLGSIELNTANQNLPCRSSQWLVYSSGPQIYFSPFKDNLVDPILHRKTLANARGDIQNI